MTSFLKNVAFGLAVSAVIALAVLVLAWLPWLCFAVVIGTFVVFIGSIARELWHERNCTRFFCLGPDFHE